MVEMPSPHIFPLPEVRGSNRGCNGVPRVANVFHTTGLAYTAIVGLLCDGWEPVRFVRHNEITPKNGCVPNAPHASCSGCATNTSSHVRPLSC